jgi:hypothetical protein
MNLGVPELLVILMIAALYLIPIAAALWALVTLQRLRAGQQAVQVKLDTIERLLQRS